MDYTKSNNLKLLKQSSIDPNLRLSDMIDLTQENYNVNSGRFGSDYEAMLKTMNSFGSFTNSDHYHNQRSRELFHLDQQKNSRIFKANNCSSIEPIYNANTIILEKKSRSYQVNQSKISQSSNVNLLSRQSMNLTPQLLSPDVEETDKPSVLPQKVRNPASRNIKNLLSKQRVNSYVTTCGTYV